MFGDAKQILEDGLIAINSRFDKLVTSLKTFVDYEEDGDNATTSYAYFLDAFRLSLHLFHFN
jgi:hypothetical protein